METTIWSSLAPTCQALGPYVSETGADGTGNVLEFVHKFVDIATGPIQTAALWKERMGTFNSLQQISAVYAQ